MEMQFTGERFVPSEGGQIRYEHLHRYALCAKLSQGKIVLDIASGEGYGSAILAKVACSVFGVDIDPKSVAFAQEKYQKFSNLEFKVGSCDNIPLPSQSVDVVTSFETIEHHEKHEEMMKEIKRVLKPGGLLIISSPDKLTYSDIPNYSNSFHVKELYRSELSNLLNNYFNHVDLYGQRLAIGSFVYTLDQSNQDIFQAYTINDFEDVVQRVCPLNSAIYFIAVCSDEPIDSLGHTVDSVYIDRIDDLYNALSSNLSFYFHQAHQVQSELQQLKQQLQQQCIASNAQLDTQNIVVVDHSENIEKHTIVQNVQRSPYCISKKIFNFPYISSLNLEQEQPFWSVMIPVYNPNLAYLEQTLKSVLSQDPGLEKMQIAVIDDCSENPELGAWIQEIGQGRIDFYRRAENLGLLPSWNDCLQRAKGHWVHLLHQDDIVLSGFYARLQSALTQPDIGAAFCRHFHINDTGNRYYVSPIEKQTSGILENWSERLATAQRIQFASIVVRRSTYETLGGFCLEAQSAADWEMWQRIAANYPVWYEPEPLACYRLHDRSESSRLYRSGQNIADVRCAIQIAAAYLPPEKAVNLVNQALENYALMALSTAEQMLVANDTEAAVAQIREGLKCSQSSSIQTRLMAMLLAGSSSTQPTDTELAPGLFTDSSDLTGSLQRYKTDPLDEAAKAYLLQIREQIAQMMLNCSEEQFAVKHQANWLNPYQVLLASGIQNEPWLETEQKFIKTLFDRINSESNQFLRTQSLMVAMLYCRPEQLPWQFNLNTIPELIVDDYLKFMMTPPALFQQIGDADRYYQFMQCWIDYLHSQITTNPNVPLWQKVAVHFTATANFIPLYFNNENLKEIYIKRSQIIASALTQRGYQLDYEFPERSADRKKIRLGILSAHFSPQSETFASLPSYKHLDRDQFEIILFSLTETQHRLERYCIGHADAFVVLKEDLANQVQIIRQADLDMLLVITNVTAVSNAVALLTMHRLARIQVINVCSCTSTGMEHADYYISGTLTEPDATQQRHTEKLLLVEGPAHCYDLATEEFARPTIAINRSDLGIADDEIVYISGSNFFKILPEVELSWVQILAKVPRSRLILYPFNPNWAESYPKATFRQRLQRTLEAHSIAIDRVIVLEPAPSYGDVKERLKLGDVYLDAFPFAGATSLIDPLTLGLPTVVMDGQVFRSRMGAAFLRELEMPELIATTPEEYIKLAITLGTDSEARLQKHSRIIQQMQQKPKFVDSWNHSKQMGELLQELAQNHQATVLRKNLKLRKTNLIVFPDWHQSEEMLFEDLTNLIASVVTHPEQEQIALLIYVGDMGEAEVDMFISGVLMYLFTEQGIEVSEAGPEIVLLRPMDSSQWKVLMPLISGYIELSCNNQRAIEQLQAKASSSLVLNSFL